MRHPMPEGRSASVSPAFSDHQYDEAYPPGIERSFWHVARNSIILKWLKTTGMNRLRLLEIGCGRGIIVDYLRGRGIDCVGCDLADPSVPPHLSGKVFPATDFRNLPVATRQSIEGVLLCDVIEHLEDPTRLLRTLPEFLPNLGRILITVPARHELWSEWDDHFGHFRRYDLDMLQRELDASAFTLVASRYFFHALYLPMRITRRHRRGTMKPPEASWLHRIVGGAMIFEQLIVPARIPGTSIIALADVRLATSERSGHLG
jgi:2-polyprenyl-3-methyl-5-hydroxy-6-metoxy-1,4-benzoquinol methylase